jgi:hypothetical protein
MLRQEMFFQSFILSMQDAACRMFAARFAIYLPMPVPPE